MLNKEFCRTEGCGTKLLVKERGEKVPEDVSERDV